MNTKNFIVVLIVLLVTFVISVPAFFIVPLAKESVRVADFPMEFGGWAGKDLPIEERAYEILETRNLILREYEKNGQKAYLYIIYSQDNRKVSHPPEVCFEGSGITIVNKKKIQLELAGGKDIFANKLEVEKSGIYNIVVYWYKAGDNYTDNYFVQQFMIALSALRFKHSSGAMIRVSSEASTLDREASLQNIREFSKEASKYFSKIIP